MNIFHRRRKRMAVSHSKVCASNNCRERTNLIVVFVVNVVVVAVVVIIVVVVVVVVVGDGNGGGAIVVSFALLTMHADAWCYRATGADGVSLGCGRFMGGAHLHWRTAPRMTTSTSTVERSFLKRR